MSQTLEKRSRELEAVPAFTDVVCEAKRFHGEETDRFCRLLQLDKILSQEEVECAPSEEVINEVMKSLEEEIGTICFTSYPSSNSGDNSAPSDISGGQEGETLASDSQVDLFLLEASDDELGVPLSPFLDFDNEVWQLPKETSEGLLENPDLKFLGEIWHFEDDIENYQQFALYEDACEASQAQEYMNRAFVSQYMCYDAEFFGAWTLETAGCL